LSFHAIPFGQLGYGKNGFGIDYGRYNVTLNPDDRYKFRTPPLYNVLQTAPYSHSGSAFDLNTAIRSHVDPLGVLNLSELSDIQRVEFYKRLRVWSEEPIYEVYLDNKEIDELVAFLGTLSFPDPEFGSTD
jgi:cytochrome c peroxidase